jgi:hypothetical protein
MSTTENVATLLQHLLTLPDICLGLRLNEAVCDLSHIESHSPTSIILAEV